MNIFPGITSVLLSVMFLSVFVISSSYAAGSGKYEEYINLGRFSEKSIDNILEKASGMDSESKRIDFISGQFLGIPYKSSTLIGDSKHHEKLTIDLAGVDCFTFLDYVEAMSLSCDYEQFRNNLVDTRYRDSEVKYKNRNHFFTDWAAYNDLIKDVTDEIGMISMPTMASLTPRSFCGSARQIFLKPNSRKRS